MRENIKPLTNLIIIILLFVAFYLWATKEYTYCESFRGMPVEQVDKMCLKHFQK